MAGASNQFSPNTVFDSLFSFEAGMNAGENALLLQKNELAFASNLTVRGTFAHPRSPRNRYTLDLTAAPQLATEISTKTFLFQGYCYYQPDSGNATVMASITGRLYQFIPNFVTKVATVIDVTGANPQSPTATQCWLFQAENFVIWNDGINLPVFFDGTNTRRSRGNTGVQPPNYLLADQLLVLSPGQTAGIPFVQFAGLSGPATLKLTQNFVGLVGDNLVFPGVPGLFATVTSGVGTTSIGVNLTVPLKPFLIGSGTLVLDTTAAPTDFTLAADTVIPNGYQVGTSTSTVNLTANYTGLNGDFVTISNGSTLAISGTVTAGAGTPTLTITLLPPVTLAPDIYNGTPITLRAGSKLNISTPPNAPAQFPVGRMGAYGKGRIWMSLADGQQFMAGDIVGGPSGTKSLDYRDAILNITENAYLVGGGKFRVPGSIGDIRAMIFEAELDVSLGQGPLQVYTPTHVFSCQAPVDRLTWQSLTNPILTETVIANGGLGQNSTFLVNSDTYYRAVDGWRSLILARRDFEKWNNTPISHEVDRILAQDNQALLPWGTGCFFDNRAVMSIAPVSTANGVYHQGMVVINTDLITTIRGKNDQDPAYDGVWPGQNVMGIITGQFSLVQRCFQFVFNTVQTSLELWELLTSAAADVTNNPNPVVGDNGTDAIQWWFESPSLQFRESIENRTYKGLINGEIHVDNLVGRVDFQVFWKPDQYPCWIPWHSWSECARQNTGASTDNTKPQFRPRMGLGTPSKRFCDPSTNRPLAEGYTFQIKVVVTGQCEFIGFRCAAVVLPEPTFAAPACSVLC